MPEITPIVNGGAISRWVENNPTATEVLSLGADGQVYADNGIVDGIVDGALVTIKQDIEDLQEDKVDNNDPRLTDAREWTAETVSKAEAETGTATTRRAWTALRVREAIASWWAGSSAKTKLDGIEDNANDYVHPTQSAIDVNTTNNGINIISRVQANTLGHVTAVSTRNLSEATTSAAGVMSAADKTKLDGVATGATANSADATLLARANHTGTQAISTVTNLQTSLDAKAPLASPALTGTPTAPTASAATSNTQIATTKFVGDWWAASADKTKLNGIAIGATANSPDATLLARANHTGVQAISTITGLQTSLDGKSPTNHTHAAATTSVDGFMSSADKLLLNAIAENFPIITQQPQSLEVYESQNATFTVAVSSGTAIQWQQSTDGTTWSDIPGATSSNYTKTSTTRTTDNGLKIRTAAAKNGVTIYSDVATLSVWNPSVLSGKHFFASAMRNMFVERGAQTTPSGVSDPVGSWVADYPDTEILSAAADANRGTRVSQGILFDGIDDYYRSASEHLRDFTRAQNSVWVWANVTKPAHGSNRIIFSIAGSLAGYSVFNLRFSTTGVLQLVIRNVYTDTSQLINLQDLSSIATNTPISIGLHVDYQNGKVQAIVNKITSAQQNLGFSGTAADVRAVNCTFGATSETTLNGQFSGVIGDLCLIRGSLSGSDLTKMTNYMATRVGIV